MPSSSPAKHSQPSHSEIDHQDEMAPRPPRASSATSSMSKKRARSADLADGEETQSPLGEIIREDRAEPSTQPIPSKEASTSHVSKKPKTSPPVAQTDSYQSPVLMTLANLPRFSRKKVDSARLDNSGPSRSSLDPDRPTPTLSTKRSHSPCQSARGNSVRDRRPIKRRRSRSPAPLRRSPTPPARSPPRKFKRPGGASRLSAAEKDALKKRQEERHQAQTCETQVEAASRGLQDVVREHYNAVPERGRDWRKTDSRIRGLRSFNNWVKSTIIQKFSPNEDHALGGIGKKGWADGIDGGGLDVESRREGLLVLDIGCGKGGDLGKWQLAPQQVELYIGVDPADVSIEQARDRYRQMRDGGRGPERGGRRGHQGGRPNRKFQAEFFVKDAFGEWLGDLPLIRDVGIDGSIGSDQRGLASSRWGGGGGFDVVSMMFCMHYAFESEEKARGMLRNVAGSLKKGGRFLGVIPNSDVMSEKVIEHHKQRSLTANGHHLEPKAGVGNTGTDEPLDKKDEEGFGWGNSLYRVRFPGKTPDNGIFRPPFGWKYSYYMEEAVEGVPEYVVPWEAFRASVHPATHPSLNPRLTGFFLRVGSPRITIWSYNIDGHSRRCGSRRRMTRSWDL